MIGNLAANRELARRAIRAAVAEGAGVVLLPELVSSGYVFASREEAASVAVDAAHPLLEDWATEAGRGGALVIGGFCERDRDGRLFNSAAAVDGSGVLAVYRKTHLWDREKLIFEPGSEAPPRSRARRSPPPGPGRGPRPAGGEPSARRGPGGRGGSFRP